MKVIAVILSAGSGSRMGKGLEQSVPKQYMKLAGKKVIEHTITLFEESHFIDEICLVINSEKRSFVQSILDNNSFTKKIHIIEGGKTRQESSFNAIKSLSQDSWLLFHDAVRPLLPVSIIQEITSLLQSYRAVDVCIPVSDTIVHSKDSGVTIADIPRRDEFFLGQTPQAFHYDLINRSYKEYFKDPAPPIFTDDCGLVKHYFPEEPIAIAKGSLFNHKITYESDLFLVDRLFQMRSILPLSNLEEQDFFKGKVFVIFGLSRGIGAQLGKDLIEQGAKVYGGGSSLVDVRSSGAIGEYLEKVDRESGQIDGVIVTSGILQTGRFASMDYKQIDDLIEINYLGSIRVAKESYRYLKKTHGQILFFSSSSYSRGRENYAIYSSSKAAIVNFSQALSQEWAKDNILVNCAIPERTKTDMRESNFGEENSDNFSSILTVEEVSRQCMKILTSRHSLEPFLIRKLP